jgi:hypothetical protein
MAVSGGRETGQPGSRVSPRLLAVGNGTALRYTAAKAAARPYLSPRRPRCTGWTPVLPHNTAVTMLLSIPSPARLIARTR